MRTIFIIPLVLLSLVSFPSWGLTTNDLVKRDGLYYQKFTDVPFTGEIDEGLEKGSLKHGKKEGLWVDYWDDGKLWRKVDYKTGKRHGMYISYHQNGQL